MTCEFRKIDGREVKKGNLIKPGDGELKRQICRLLLLFVAWRSGCAAQA
jgi:hypothetical protein